MSSVIEFLERMGSDAQWQYASLEEMKQALAEAGIEAPLCTAILNKDISGLQALLRQMPLFSIQIPPDEDDEDEKNEPNEMHQ